MVAALDGDVDGLGEQRGDVELAQPALDHPAEGRLDVPVVEHLDDALHGITGGARGTVGVFGHGEPAAEALADVDTLQPLGEHLAGEEVALHELAEAAPDLVLAVGDDRGVRDRQPEGVSEQRRDREPVGERADHRRLRERPHVADPTRAVLLVRPGDEVDAGGEDEQPGREQLHPPQVAEPDRIVSGHQWSRHRSNAHGTTPQRGAVAPCGSRRHRHRANCVVVSAASSSHSGKNPTRSVNPAASAIASPAENGTCRWVAPSSPSAGVSAIHVDTMIRR